MSWTADLDPRLADIAEQLETTGGAAEIYDTEWRLVYLTSQFRFFAGDKSLEELGLGRHAVSIRAAELHGMVPDEVELRWLRTNIPLMAHDTPGGADAIRAMLPDEAARALGPLEPREPQTLWWGELTYLQPGLPPAQTRYLTFALVEPDGERIGWANFYLPAAPGEHRLADHPRQPGHVRPHGGAAAAGPPRDGDPVRRHPGLERARAPPLLAALVRADPRLPRPRPTRPRSAAPGSSASTPATAMTAFFLAEHAGSRAAACAAALEAGREIVDWRPPGMERGELRINAGVHWGGALYLGQVITGGRLEVTALGDEVNECARIQQSARDGALLASKPLVERLDPEHAEAFGLDPLTIMYRTVGELPGVTPKAVRDAGGIPVVTVPRQPAR